ncbi:MAG: hypothetical protein Q4A09_06960 [Capnocytophaga felis]|nr:hypothetical protein [Capnocytophaga felis]
MKPKIIYLLFLSVGVISLSNCQKEIEYRLFADIVYVNNTQYNICYYKIDPISNQKEILLQVAPNSSYKKEVRLNGGNRINKPEFYKYAFVSFQDYGTKIIEYNYEKCVTYKEGEGSTTNNFLNSYQWHKMADHHFEFTYTFTEEEAQKATACP